MEHQRNMPENNLNIQIDGQLITKVQKAKYLGLILDERLNWCHRIDHITNKITSVVGTDST